MEEKRDYKIVPEKGRSMYDMCFCMSADCKTPCMRNINRFQPSERYFTASDIGPLCSSYLPDDSDNK